MKMLNIIFSVGFVILFIVSCSEPVSQKEEIDQVNNNILEPVSYLDVELTDNFWKPKIEQNRKVGIWHALGQLEESIKNFDVAAGKSEGGHRGNTASDSDVYKTLQGGAHSLHHSSDEKLESTIDSIIDRIVAAQQPDGYLFTYWIIKDPSQRWTDLERKHELYCAGHMFEAAVAYYRATGKRKFLDAALRFADHIDSIFGPQKRPGISGHEEIELALYKLYKVTREKKYLDLSAFFIDGRGDAKTMIAEKIAPPDRDPNANTPQRWRPPSYRQDHLPVTQQFYAVGHAVCATYLYTAMTDLSMDTKSTKYLPALDSIWNDIVSKKLYITGGIGSRQFHDEGFGSAYLLPIDQAYAETCSSIGSTFWNRRMNLLTGDAKYADLLELTMYNAAIAGVSLSGDRFFYTNRLESNGDRERNIWDNPPCCPTNMVRFLPEIGATIYGYTSDAVYINQFIASKTTIGLFESKVAFNIEANYPWEGEIKIIIEPEAASEFRLNIRIPGWANGNLLPSDLYGYLNNGETKEGFVIKVNGETFENPKMVNGYVVIDRSWENGDVVELSLPMDVKYVTGNPKIKDTHNKTVLTRGPLVYCLEGFDNDAFFDVNRKPNVLPNTFKTEYDENLLNGVVKLKGQGSHVGLDVKYDITAVPYYAWNNRGKGQMNVWLPLVKKIN
jgi:DUF1680 family protein